MTTHAWIHNTISVASASRQELYILTTSYPESDALNPGGQLLHHALDDSSLTESVLSTAHPLSAMWISSDNHIWLAGADGTAWTTAPVSWPRTGAGVDADGAGLTWVTTALPPLAASGIAPNITTIWGDSDTAVFFASTSGAVYQWNGSDWLESSSGTGASLTRLHGRSPDDVYAVGYHGTAAHWDGGRWTVIAAPDLVPASTIMTGIVAVERDHAFAVTNRGHLLELSAGRFDTARKLAHVRFTGLVAWRNALFLASATGAWRFDGVDLVHLNDKFSATNVQVAGDRLYFIETEQPDGPACVEYYPERPAGSPWQRIVF